MIKDKRIITSLVCARGCCVASTNRKVVIRINVYHVQTVYLNDYHSQHDSRSSDRQAEVLYSHHNGSHLPLITGVRTDELHKSLGSFPAPSLLRLQANHLSAA